MTTRTATRRIVTTASAVEASDAPCGARIEAPEQSGAFCFSGATASDQPHLFLVYSDPEAFHQKQNSGDEREESSDPTWDRKTEQEIQAENDEEERENEVSHEEGWVEVGEFALRKRNSSGREKPEAREAATITGGPERLYHDHAANQD